MLNEVEEALGYYFATAVIVYGMFGVVAGVVAWLGGLGNPALWGVAAFPDEALTFEDLLQKARERLIDSTLPASEVVSVVESHQVQ